MHMKIELGNKGESWKILIANCVFLDHELERQTLFSNVFPQLQEFCQQRNLGFEVLDLRWRAGKNIDLELRETGSYRREIQHCKDVSLGPYFVVILCTAYFI